MKTAKKLLTLALAALMLLSLAAPALAADGDVTVIDGCEIIEIDGINISGISGVIYPTLWGYTGPGGDVVIPDVVTAIGGRALSDCTSITSVTIPSGVTFIGQGAFSGCTSLTSVVIPSGVTFIGMDVFMGCTSLTDVTIPASVTDIGWYAFEGCTSLTDIYFGGTQEQWGTAVEGSIFDEGANVTIHYNSTGPAASSTPAAAGFADVAEGAYYAEPVKWAVEKGITKGTSATSFSPEKTCNTAEILTFLWRACDKPEAPAVSFSDVAANAFYADAASWAKSKGMVSGSVLSPETPCTRASAVMFIWQACGSPAASKSASFSDVPANSDYAAAVAWAVEKGVTKGTSAAAFSPDEICSRGHIVTFLYRAMA